MIFRRLPVERDQLAEALAQAGDAVLLAAGDHDQPAGLTRSSASAMPSSFWPRCRPQSTSAPRSPRLRHVASTRCSLRAAAPESRAGSPAPATVSHRSRRAAGSPVRRRGTARARRPPAVGSMPALERMEQGLQGVAAHRHALASWRAKKRARPRGRARPYCDSAARIRRRSLRSLPSSRGRVPCRSSGRRPSSTGGPCRARRSPSA